MTIPNVSVHTLYHHKFVTILIVLIVLRIPNVSMIHYFKYADVNIVKIYHNNNV